MAEVRTALLTGVTGFIAKRIALDLLNAGWAVRGSLRSTGRADEVREAVRPQLADPSALDRLTFVELDLTRDAGWDTAMQGADVLVHTASPFPMSQPKDENELIRPAVDGARRALKAAQAAGVTRVVLTSSVAAVMNAEHPQDHVLTEDDWTDTGHPTATAYDKSKTLAEKAAWAFVADHPEMQLTTINPGLVTGRPLDSHYGTSLQLIERLFSGKDPAQPNFGLPIVDVADVSAMHVRALERPETAGRRYLAADSWAMLPEIADWLKQAHPDRKISTRVAPKWLLRLLSPFDPAVRSVLPTVGRRFQVSNQRARTELDIRFVPARESVLATAEFLKEQGR